MSAASDNEASLHAQIKLLVQTEQRLHRSQTELDRQLTRIETLADWSLRVRIDESPEALLAAGLALFAEVITCDWALALELQGDRLLVCAALPAPERMDPPPTVDGAERWFSTIHEPTAYPGAVPDPLVRLLARVEEAAGTAEFVHRKPDTALLLVPLRVASGPSTAILLCTVNDRRGFSGGDGRSVLPFVQLVASHVENALHNSALSRSLRLRTEELGESLVRLESAQAELVHGRKMEAIGALAGGVAHDFNNLLTVILSHAQLLRPEVSTDDAAADVEAIVDAASQAAGITRQLLALGRRQRLTIESVDLNRTIPQSADMFRRVLGEGIELRIDLGSGDCTVYADRGQTEQVLLNLLANARDAMPGGGTVTVATRAPRGPEGSGPDGLPSEYVTLEVTDTGPGMDDAVRARIFEPFFTTRDSGRGAGMGLAVVYGIVTQIGGTVSVRSAPGEGACFTLVLPPPAASARAPRATAPRRATILLVEDEDAIRRLTRRVLEGAGFAVVEAANGEEALAVWARRAAPIHLLLTDVVMPRMGGVELIDRLGTEDPGLHVVLMSGCLVTPLADDVRRRVGAYLPKPFGPSELLSCVEATLKPRPEQ